MKIIAAMFLSCISCSGAILMDGAFDFFERIDRDGLSFTNAITISIWVSKSATLGASAELFNKGRVNNSNKSLYNVRNSSGKWEFYFAAPDGTFHVFTTSSSFTETNVMHHLVYVGQWGNSNSSQFYVDGDKVTGVWTANPVNTAGLNNTEPNRIGVSGVATFWAGAISEVSLWSTNLPAEKVKSMYVSHAKMISLQMQPNALIFYLPVDEGHDFSARPNGLLLRDLSGINNTFTPNSGSSLTGIEFTERRNSYQPNE
jgi:hypothetical protein